MKRGRRPRTACARDALRLGGGLEEGAEHDVWNGFAQEGQHFQRALAWTGMREGEPALERTQD